MCLVHKMVEKTLSCKKLTWLDRQRPQYIKRWRCVHRKRRDFNIFQRCNSKPRIWRLITKILSYINSSLRFGSFASLFTVETQKYEVFTDKSEGLIFYNYHSGRQQFLVLLNLFPCWVQQAFLLFTLSASCNQFRDSFVKMNIPFPDTTRLRSESTCTSISSDCSSYHIIYYTNPFIDSWIFNFV